MPKGGGSLDRGRRTRDEVPLVPEPSSLSDLEQRAQGALRRLVDDAGGRFGPGDPIPAKHLEVFAQLFQEWAIHHGHRSGSGVRFGGRPGLWHALDGLYPLQDPNRWDGLRLAILRQLQQRGWRRVTPPRGSAFDIPLTVDQ